MNHSVAGHILTHSGVLVNPINPDPETILIEDIAHSLSMQCRYNGHTSKFYSVAEHSWWVSKFCTDESALWALLHDATEAYLCDIPRPIKPLLTNYVEIETRLMEAIARKFGLDGTMPSEVKLLDCAMLLPERDQLMPNALGDWTQLPEAPDLRERVYVECWTPDMARHWFMERFKELT
jgi:hypothetical protein